MKLTNERTLNNVIKDLTSTILGYIEDLKKEPKTDWNTATMLAYFECLTAIKCEMLPNEARFGLDGNLEEKYGLNEYLNRKE